MKSLSLLLFAVPILILLDARAQDAVPIEIQQRTVFIKGSEAGTAFSIDYQGKVFLVTARHVVAGLPPQKATIQIWHDEKWEDYHTIKTIFPSSGDVDIAIFETAEKVSTPYSIRPDETAGGGVTMGQRVWFLGYPFGIATHFRDGKRAPFLKSGTMSAIDATNPDAVVIYIDGFNNPGFSGGADNLLGLHEAFVFYPRSRERIRRGHRQNIGERATCGYEALGEHRYFDCL